MKLTRENNGLLFELQQYILQNSWVKQPDLALSAALMIVSTAINRHQVLYNNCPNLYCLNIAASGSGKDAPQQAVKNVLLQCQGKNLLGAGDYVSDASLMDTLTTQPARVDVIDEASGFLASATKGQATYNGKIADILCELYTSANDYYQGRMLAGGIKKGECARPFVNLLMSTTLRGFEQGMNIQAIEKGMLGRCLLFFADNQARSTMPNINHSISDSIRLKMNKIMSYIPQEGMTGVTKKNFGDFHHYYFEAQVHESAKSEMNRLINKYEDIRLAEEEDSNVRPIIARCFQMVCKLSLVNSVAREDSNAPAEIRRVDLDFAEQLVDNNLSNFRNAMDTMLFETRYEEKMHKVRKAIKSKGTLSLKEITNVSRCKARERDEMLRELESMGDIIPNSRFKEGSARPQTVYMWAHKELQ